MRVIEISYKLWKLSRFSLMFESFKLEILNKTLESSELPGISDHNFMLTVSEAYQTSEC